MTRSTNLRTCHKFIWSSLSIFILVLFLIPKHQLKAQTTYDWLNTAPDANWRQGAAGARWNPGGLFDEPPFGILAFNNNHQLVMTNNVGGTYGQHQIIFGAFNTNSRTINGNPVRLFDFGGADPKIENYSTANHTINLNINGDGDAGDPLEVNPINGGLTLNGTLNNQGSPVYVFGNNNQTVTFNGIISGAGGFEVRQNSIAVFTAVNTYTGATTILNGVLQLSTNGIAIPSANTVTINGGTLRISNAAATSSARNITLTAGTLALGAVASASTTNVGTVAISPNTGWDLSAAPASCSLVVANTSGLASGNLTITGWIPTKRIIITNIAHITGAGILGRINFFGYGVGAKIINGNELVPQLLFVTNGTSGGNFNNPTSWLNSDPPTANTGTESIYIQPGDVLTQNTNFNVLNAQIGGMLTMNAVNSLTVSGTATHSGTINMVNGSVINLVDGATWARTTGGSFAGSPQGRIHFLGGGTVTGTVTFPDVVIDGAVDFGTGSTIGGSSSLTINASGSVLTNAPTYAAGSTLIYNTAGYNRNDEWKPGSSGPGIPHHVRVNSGGVLNLDVVTAYNGEGRTMLGDLDLYGTLTMGNTVATFNGSMAEDLIVRGSVTIRSGGALILGCQEPGTGNTGDIQVGGNWNHLNGGTFTPAQRAVIFNGTGTQTVNYTGAGDEQFAYFIVEKPDNGDVLMNCNAYVYGSNKGHIFQLLNGNLDLNGYTVTLETMSTLDGDAANHVDQKVYIDGTAGNLTRRVKNSSGSAANFIFLNNKFGTHIDTIERKTPATASLLRFDPNIVVQISNLGGINNFSGVNFGSGITTIDGTLQINYHGFVNTNPPTYSDNSLLQYNIGEDYGRSFEWSTAASGPGHPFNVQISKPGVPQTRLIAGPTVAYSTTALNLRGSLTIDAGNTFDMTNAAGGTATNMTVPLTAGLDINISGTLIASQNAGGNIILGRSWTRFTGGVFTHNNRSVTFNSNNNGTVAGPLPGGESFYSVIINKTNNNNTITLNSPVTVTNTTAGPPPALTLTNGVFVSSVSNLFIMNAGTSYTGGSTNSFVGGPLKKIGNTAFTYPVGKIAGGANHYRTIGISAPGNVTDEFTAEFHRSSSYNVGTITPAAAGTGLQWVSACEYWDLVRDVGGSTVSVTLSWTAQSRCNVGNYINDFASLVVVENLVNPRTWSGVSPNWGDNYGGTVNVGSTTSTGTITWATTSIYHRFTLGTTDTRFNPLPFSLLQFEGIKRTADVLLQWKVAGNLEQKEYILEHSTDGIHFKPIAIVPAKADQDQASYSGIHNQPAQGLNHYRVTAKSHLNQLQSSHTIQVWFGQSTGKPGIYPNPIVNSQVNIHTNGLPKGVYNIQLVGMDGKLLLQQRWVNNGNQPVYQLHLNPALPRGMYWITIAGDQGEPVQLKILK